MTHDEFQKLKDNFMSQLKNNKNMPITNSLFGARKQSRTQGGNRPGNKLQVELSQPLSQQ